MKLLVINGSPRAGKSNTKKIIENFCNGFLEDENNQVKHIYLIQEDINNIEFQIKESDICLLAFPLYVLSMPGFVKETIEKLSEGIGKGKKFIGFVQSGFPETYQFKFIEEYLLIMASRLQFDYVGTIIKGYGASVEMMPQIFNKALYKNMFLLGYKFKNTLILDKKIMAKLKKPYRFSMGQALFYKFLRITGALDAYTGEMTKENNISYEQSISKPLLNKN